MGKIVTVASHNGYNRGRKAENARVNAGEKKLIDVINDEVKEKYTERTEILGSRRCIQRRIRESMS